MFFIDATSLKVSILLILSLGTILFFNLYDRYSDIGPELLKNIHFHENLAEWEVSSQGVSVQALGAGIVRLHSDNAAIKVDLSQNISIVRCCSLLRFSGDIKTDNVSQGQEPWMTARVVLVSHDSKGEPMYHLPHTLANLPGTHNWEHHEAVFAPHANTAWVRVTAQFAQATGTMWVRNLSLKPVVGVDSFHAFRKAVSLLWATVILWITASLIRSALGNTHRTIIIALAIAIMFGVLMSEGLKESIGNSLFPSLTKPSIATLNTSTFKFTPLLPKLDVYKSGHYFLFSLLAVAALYRRPYPTAHTRIFGYLVLFALVTEVLQLLIDGRTAQFGDVLIDCAGISTGLTLLRIARIFTPYCVKSRS